MWVCVLFLCLCVCVSLLMPRFEVCWPKGVGYRHAPELDAKCDGIAGFEDLRPAKKGDVVTGTVQDGWLAAENGLFLPLRAPDGRSILKRLPDLVPWDDGECDGNSASAPLPPQRPAPASGESEMEALHRMGDKKFGRRGGGRPPAAVTPPGSEAARSGGRGGSMRVSPGHMGRAAVSHEAATNYMHEFREGLEAMGIDSRGDPYLEAYAPQRLGPPSVQMKSGGSSAGGSRPSSGGSGGAGAASRGRAVSSGATRRRADGRGMSAVGDVAIAPGGGCGPLALCGAMVVTRSAASGAGSRWREGPANAVVPVQEWVSVKHGREQSSRCSSGRLIDVSDRNIMCMSVFGEKAVMGSADHGLKEVNVRAGQVLRNLYTKRYGHTEWVTTVSHCPDGRVVSGGMDSKVCLWNATGVVCADLVGHLGSVSRVRTSALRNIAISSGYDRSLRAWDLRSKTEVACCNGHKAPILDFIWANDVVVSGDRSGVLMVWDTSRGEAVGTLKGHKGHITAMAAMPEPGALPGVPSVPVSASGDGVPTSPIVTSGAQDGQVRVWDLRQRLNVCSIAAHPGGAVNELAVTLGTGPPVLVSVGADGRLLMLEPRENFRPLFELGSITQDFVYSLLVLDDLAFTGDGHGVVTCFDVRTGQQRYTLEAGQNAIRCLGASATSLVCAGDDGNAVIFDF